MAIAIDNPDLHEGREIVLWQVRPPRKRRESLPPGQKRITSPIKGKGRIIPGGIDYASGTLTIQTDTGAFVTGPASDADFTDVA